MTRALWLGSLALLLLAGEAAPVRADLPGPYPWSKRPERPIRPWTPPASAEEGTPVPNVLPVEQPPPPPPMYPASPNQPNRSGLFRSCGSGMGAGLAGIGLAWGTLWLGTRFARGLRSPSARG